MLSTNSFPQTDGPPSINYWLSLYAMPLRQWSLEVTRSSWNTRNIPGMGHRGNFDIVPLCTHRQTYWQTDTIQCPKILISPIPHILRVDHGSFLLAYLIDEFIFSRRWLATIWASFPSRTSLWSTVAPESALPTRPGSSLSSRGY